MLHTYGGVRCTRCRQACALGHSTGCQKVCGFRNAPKPADGAHIHLLRDEHVVGRHGAALRPPVSGGRKGACADARAAAARSKQRWCAPRQTSRGIRACSAVSVAYARGAVVGASVAAAAGVAARATERSARRASTPATSRMRRTAAAVMTAWRVKQSRRGARIRRAQQAPHDDSPSCLVSSAQPAAFLLRYARRGSMRALALCELHAVLAIRMTTQLGTDACLRTALDHGRRPADARRMRMHAIGRAEQCNARN